MADIKRQFLIDKIVQIKQYTLSLEDDIFSAILNERQNDWDSNRFFLQYLPQEVLDEYDFTNPNSLSLFRKICWTNHSPLKEMGGCNLNPEELEDDIRITGIKMSDPYGYVRGVFDIRNNVITYSPIFPLFYEERDLIKFAKDVYFTPMTFEDIMREQIDKAMDFYVHTGNYRTVKDTAKYGEYILEKITKDQMLDFVLDANEGIKIYKKNI